MTPARGAARTRGASQAYAKLEEIEACLFCKFLTCKQANALLEKFPPDSMVRVELLLRLFERAVDLELLGPVVLDRLSQDEQDEAQHRFGYMNLFNPVYPDRRYKCDLAVRDHREMVKVRDGGGGGSRCLVTVAREPSA